MTKPVVLLTNDDGPPGRESPYVFGLYRNLVQSYGWDVKVVLPSSQKSWIGKAYQIAETIRGRYYYPKEPNGFGESSENSRPLKEGEVAEWILLDGTPATCANVALHNLYPGQISLLISGPNFGRNTSSAFSLSSGTIGAALSSSLSGYRSIAISYGTVLKPTPDSFFQPAHMLGGRIINHLWDNWGKDEGGIRNSEVDLYSVNIPMIEGLLSEEGLKICWTKIWRNSYQRLFKPVTEIKQASGPPVPASGPDSLQARSNKSENVADEKNDLVFKFAPDMKDLINPEESVLPIGSDGWAFRKGWVSVTPLRASFAEPEADDTHGAEVENRVWKMKL